MPGILTYKMTMDDVDSFMKTIPGTPRVPTDVEIEILRRSIDENKQMKAIARAFGVSDTTIRRWIEKYVNGKG